MNVKRVVKLAVAEGGRELFVDADRIVTVDRIDTPDEQVTRLRVDVGQMMDLRVTEGLSHVLREWQGVPHPQT